jgi:predicted NUDIX family NTP pyrophosphohydrolase
VPKISAGLLMYRLCEGGLEFLLVHPGGPFWKNKDHGAWTIPKGELQEGEDPFACARREFAEELNLNPEGQFIELTPIQQKGGKIVHAWAFEGNCDPARIKSNLAKIEWPPASGRFQSFPEVDKAAFFTPKEARNKINAAQVALLDELERKLLPTS